MRRTRLHPNASAIRSQAVWLRYVSRILIVAALLLFEGSRVVIRGISDFTIDTASGNGSGASVAVLVSAVFVLVCMFLLYYWNDGNVGVRVLARRLTGYGAQSMHVWARSRGHQLDTRRPLIPHVPELRKKQDIHHSVTFQHDDGREWVLFEATCGSEEAFEGTRKYMTGIAFSVDSKWTNRLPLVTVSPSSQAFVGGKHNLRDRRWERQDLDSRFQIDARVIGQESELKFVQLFSPEVQMALGTSFCAYWQQVDAQILVWIPGMYHSPTALEALHQDARWLYARYAQFARERNSHAQGYRAA